MDAVTPHDRKSPLRESIPHCPQPKEFARRRSRLPFARCIAVASRINSILQLALPRCVLQYRLVTDSDGT
jgi:hypothetical protein